MFSGYLVTSRMRSEYGIIGVDFIIQSVKETVYLENRIETFLSKLEVRKVVIIDFVSTYQANRILNFTVYD